MDDNTVKDEQDARSCVEPEMYQNHQTVEKKESESFSSMECDQGASENEDGNSRRNRTSCLKRAIEKSLKKCVSSASFSIFLKYLTTVAEKSDIATIHKIFKEQLQANVKNNVDGMLSQETLPDLLDELDLLCQSATLGQIAWRPSGIPKDDLASHLIPIFKKQHANLERILESQQIEFTNLRSSVAERRIILDSRLRLIKENEEKKEQEALLMEKLLRGLQDEVLVDRTF